MTRDYNKQPRENERPYSRSSSPRRNGEERSPRPARPRLNRDTVDRAWENGARQNHADYRTRSDNNSYPPRDNRRRSQYSDQPTAQNSRNNRKPYGNHQDNYRHSERNPQSNYGPRPRSFESSMRNFDERRYDEHQHRGYSDRPDQAGTRPGYRENAQHTSTRSPYRDRDQYRSPQRREFDRDARPPRSFDRDQRQTRDFDNDSRSPRRFDRDIDSRPPRSYDRDKRSTRNGPQRDTQNPRYQSRPARQSDNYPRKPQEFTRREPEQQLFEGDYEHFDVSNAAQSLMSHTEGNVVTPKKAEERPVTRLADGRALKGTEQEQRRNAEFWTEIAHETDELVQQVELAITTDPVTEHATDLPTTPIGSGKPKSPTRTTSASTRGKKTTKAKARQSTPKPRSTGPKPSQRGYKWPTPDEQ